MNIEEQIRQKLEQGLDIHLLSIKNESHKHAGHSGDDGSGESHFRLKIISNDFNGMSRLMRQRKILELLGKNLTGRIHALSFTCISVDEYEKD